jgi:hypothetical protein
MDAETWPFRPVVIPDAEARVRKTIALACEALRRPLGATIAATARDPESWQLVCEALTIRPSEAPLGETLRLTALDAAKLASRGDYRAAATHLSIAGLLQ